MQRTVAINQIEPSPLSWRQPLGVNLDLSINFVGEGDTAPAALIPAVDLMPQLILMPRSLGGIYGYAMDPAGTDNRASIQIPGTAFMDKSGYNVELYSTANGQATSLLAKGSVAIQGSAYVRLGPLGMMNAPTGPSGPAGPVGPTGAKGEQGTRGSIWFSGNGPPSVSNPQPNDNYMQLDTGDVWVYADPAGWVLQ